MIEYRSVTAPRHGDQPVPADGKLVVDKDAMSIDQLAALIEDIRWQPDWRSEADLDAAYYDGYQISPELRERARVTGQPIAVVNLMARSINAMLGQEARARSSWKVSADLDAFEDVCDAIQPKLAEAQR